MKTLIYESRHYLGYDDNPKMLSYIKWWFSISILTISIFSITKPNPLHSILKMDLTFLLGTSCRYPYFCSFYIVQCSCNSCGPLFTNSFYFSPRWDHHIICNVLLSIHHRQVGLLEMLAHVSLVIAFYSIDTWSLFVLFN